jgi:hypothetical protein
MRRKVVMEILASLASLSCPMPAKTLPAAICRPLT